MLRPTGRDTARSGAPRDGLRRNIGLRGGIRTAAVVAERCEHWTHAAGAVDPRSGPSPARRRGWLTRRHCTHAARASDSTSRAFVQVASGALLRPPIAPIRLGEPGGSPRQEPDRFTGAHTCISSVEPQTMGVGGGRSACADPPRCTGPQLRRPRANAIVIIVSPECRSAPTRQPAPDGDPAADLSSAADLPAADPGPAAQISGGCSSTHARRGYSVTSLDTGVSRPSRRCSWRPAAATSLPEG